MSVYSPTTFQAPSFYFSIAKTLLVFTLSWGAACFLLGVIFKYKLSYKLARRGVQPPSGAWVSVPAH